MNNTLKKQIKNYYLKNHKRQIFIPGIDSVKVSGRVFDHEEIENAVEASLEFWLTEGRFAEQFCKDLARFLGVKLVSLTNSGSSANLAAFYALTSPKLGDKQIKPGDEVITVACSFPTTINPIIQYGAIPVFLDVNRQTANIEASAVEKAITQKTKAIIIAHTLGNPFDAAAISKIAKKHGLWLIEDCCDALGSKYNGKYVSSFGDLATFSFYPAHQITLGEGGAVVTNNPQLHVLVNSFCEWGRDCWCRPGQDNRCGRRFKMQLGDLPYGYDHKYIYSHIGFNLKLTDIQAAIGVAQLKKLPKFISARKENWEFLKENLSKYGKYLIFHEKLEKSDPCWFGFLIVVKEKSPFTRLDLVNFLQANKIETRSLFAGNLLKHPAYKNIKHRIIGDLKNSNYLMNNAFWIGIYPGNDEKKLKYVVNKFKQFLESHN